MKKISQILPARLKHYNLDKAATSALVCNTALEISQSKFVPVSFRDGLLTLRVENSQQSVQLRFKTPQIIEEINYKLGRKVVQKLRIKV